MSSSSGWISCSGGSPRVLLSCCATRAHWEACRYTTEPPSACSSCSICTRDQACISSKHVPHSGVCRRAARFGGVVRSWGFFGWLCWLVWLDPDCGSFSVCGRHWADVSLAWFFRFAIFVMRRVWLVVFTVLVPGLDSCCFRFWSLRFLLLSVEVFVEHFKVSWFCVCCFEEVEV